MPASPPLAPYVNSTDVLFNGTQVPGNFLAADPEGPDGMALDSGHSTIYVANQYGSYVSVISASNGTVLRDILVGSSPTGVAYDPAVGQVFVTNSGSGTVSVINDTTNAVVASIRVGSGPQDVAYDNRSGELFVSNSGSSNVSVIAGGNDTLVSTLKLPSNPYVGDFPVGVVYDSHRDEIYVADYYYYGVSEFNASNLSRKAVTITTSGAPWGLAYDSGTGRIYATEPYSSNVSVISDTTRAVLTGVRVPSPIGAAYDPSTGQILVTSGSSSVDLVDDATNAIVSTNGVDGSNPWHVLYDPATNDSFVSCTGSETVTELSATGNATGRITLATNPSAVVYDSGRSELFVLNSIADDVLVVSDATGAVLATVPVEAPSYVETAGLAYDSGTAQVFVADYYADNVSIISDSTNSVVTTVSFPGSPSALVYDSSDHTVVVVAGHNVSSISDVTDHVVATDKLAGYPGGLAFDSGTGQLFVTTSGGDNVSVLNATTLTLVRNVTVGYAEDAIVYSPNTGSVFAAGSGNVSEISDSNYSVLSTVPIGPTTSYQGAMAIDPAHSELFLTEPSGNNLTTLSVLNSSVLSTLPVGQDPTSETYDFGLGAVFVSNLDGGTLSQVRTGPVTRYPLTFNESGLPTGTNWSIDLAGAIENSTNSTIGYSEPNGSYHFSVNKLPSYDPSPAGGTLVVYGAGATVQINYTFVQNYNVTFRANGLPTGTTWEVTLNGTSQRGSTSTLTFLESNGTYAFQVGSVPGFTPQPASGSVVVAGLALSNVVNFSADRYNATFIPRGLSGGTTWSVTLNNTTLAGTGRLTFGLVDGNYTFAVGAVTGYTFSPGAGTVDVAGANVSVTIRFYATVYAVTFTETGLATATNWSVTFNGTLLSGTTVNLSFPATDGDYSYFVGAVTGYTASPTSGETSVDGGNLSISINFSAVLYNVTFSEVGLGPGTLWSVVFEGVTFSGYGTSLTTSVTDGIYPFTVPPPTQYSVTPEDGNVTVAGSNVTIELTFVRAMYSLAFEETGLPSGAVWGATVNGTSSYSTETSLVFSEASGSLPYVILHPYAGYLPTPTSGTVNLTFANVTIDIRFTPILYSVTFSEIGLNSTESWSVTLGGETDRTSNSTLGFQEPNGTYSYVIVAVPGYTSNLTTGQLTVAGRSLVTDIGFVASVVPTYAVNFTERGLPSGVTWSVTLNGSVKSAPSDVISFQEPNGSYPFSIGPVDGYTRSTTSGTVVVEGGPVPNSITFTATVPAVYTVTFNESGLSSGTTWTVVVNGSTMSSGSTQLQVELRNGTYNYTFGAVAGFVTPRGGEVVVRGLPVNVSVEYQAAPSSSPSGTDYWPYVVVAVVAGVIVGVALALIRRRGRASQVAPAEGPANDP